MEENLIATEVGVKDSLMKPIFLLTDEERKKLPGVLLRRNKFRGIITKSIKMRDAIYSNGIIIIGKPGTGKTTLISEFLEQLMNDHIIDRYNRVAGHVTQSSLFEFLKIPGDEVHVHVLDDVDCMYDGGCLEIMKAALDTKSAASDNRTVHYCSRGTQNAYKYTGFFIMISNNEWPNPSPSQRAVLDRVHTMEIDLEPEDFFIFNTYLVENFLNRNEDNLEVSTLLKLAEFYDQHIRNWMEWKVFEMMDISFSLRLVRKFIDLIILHGDDWCEYSIDYKRLTNKFNEIKH